MPAVSDKKSGSAGRLSGFRRVELNPTGEVHVGHHASDARRDMTKPVTGIPRWPRLSSGHRSKIPIITLENDLPLYQCMRLSSCASCEQGQHPVRRHQAPGARELSARRRCAPAALRPITWLGGMLNQFKTVKQSIKRPARYGEQMVQTARSRKLYEERGSSISSARCQAGPQPRGIKEMNERRAVSWTWLQKGAVT